jgi:hypothetical protein
VFRLALPAAGPDAFAEGVGILEIESREALVHNRDLRGFIVVSSGELAAFE